MTTSGNETPTFSPFVCACFTVNYTVGTGFLTLPWAFDRAGVLLSAIFMVLICVISTISSDYILSTLARAECYISYLQAANRDVIECGTLPTPTDSLSTDDTPDATDEEMVNDNVALIKKKENKQPQNMYGTALSIEMCSFSENDGFVSENKAIMTESKFELVELCQFFLGDWGFRAFAFPTIFYMYGFLWAYTSVFASALAKSLPISGVDDNIIDSYIYYALLFGLITVPMSFLELSEQVFIQVLLSICRFVMIFIIIITPLVAAIASFMGKDDSSLAGSHFEDQAEPLGTALVRPSGISVMLPVLVYATLFHTAVPDLAREMSEKKLCGVVFGWTMFIIGSAYTLIGIIGAWYFGWNADPSINLNWQSYQGFHGGWISRGISFFAVLFPAVDVLSAYPLNAHVLANILMGMVYRENSHNMRSNRQVKNIFNLVASLPPIIGALFERNLGTITDYSGLNGIAVALCFPPLLYIFSEKKLQAMNLPTKTDYQRFGSSIPWAIFVFTFGVVSIVYSLIDLRMNGV